mmetsp:Transcript_104381/g.164808  ORF Transcript_104381/g.164808 Transcript_104381/m.164808 type:complete len:362 (+) Transcript_104381:42-1127(+)
MLKSIFALSSLVSNTTRQGLHLPQRNGDGMHAIRVFLAGRDPLETFASFLFASSPPAIRTPTLSDHAFAGMLNRVVRPGMNIDSATRNVRASGGPNFVDLTELAVLNARACSLAYVPSSQIETEPYASGFRVVAQVEEPSQSGATIFTFTNKQGQQQLLIACRGSASLKNFQTNLDIGPVTFDMAGSSDAQVHAGFQRVGNALWKLLQPHLPPVGMGAAAAPILVTGHSLGGGTATLVSLHLQAAGYTPELMTLAGPCLGNRAFANYFKEKCSPAYHLVHDDDEVLNSNSDLWDRLGFEHVGTVVRCEKDAACLYGPDGKKSCSNEDLPPLKFVFVDHLRYLGLYIGVRLEHPSIWFRSVF